MATTKVSGTGTSDALNSTRGRLVTASPTDTPLLASITKARGTNSIEFTLNAEYTLEDPSQGNITEDAAIAAVTPSYYTATQATNVTQIMRQDIKMSYRQQNNLGLLVDLNNTEVPNEIATLAEQIRLKMKSHANNVEYAFIRGTYAKAATSADLSGTRGLLTATALTGSTQIDAGGATLTDTIFNNLIITMQDNGADFEDMVLFCSPKKLVEIGVIYGYAPTSRQVGGVAITEIVTPFGVIKLKASRYMNNTEILLADVAKLATVEPSNPAHPNFMPEQLSKVGAADTLMIYGEIGLDYTAAFYHGSVINLAA